MQSSEPYFVLPILGPDGTGKSTLANALAMAAQVSPRGVQVDGRAATVIEIQGRSQVYQFVDFADDTTEELLLASSRARGAILVVSAQDSVMPGTQKSVAAAQACQIPIVVVALTKCDLVEDVELIDLITMEVRELLTKYRMAGDETPVVRMGEREGAARREETGPRTGPRALLDAVLR